MTTSIELYEALKELVGEEKARVIARSWPEPERLATKEDVRAEIQALRTDFAEFKAEIRGWMLQFFVPLWIGVYGTLGAVIVSVILKT